MQLDQHKTKFTESLQSSRYERPGEEPIIQRGRGDGVQFSLVHHAGIRHVFATCTISSDLLKKGAVALARDVLPRAIERAGLQVQVVRQSFFSADPAMLSSLEELRHSAGGNIAVTDLFRQAPADGEVLGVEIWGVAPGKEEPVVERPAPNLVVVRQERLSTAHAVHDVKEISGQGVHQQAIAGFEALRALLAGERIDFDRVVRTWLYLGDITGRDGDSQRYKELNRGRSDFFSTCSLGVNRSLAVTTTTKVAYPASTGIGAEGRGLALGCLALASERDDVQTIPLENPRQTAAHDYGAIYSPQSPKFSRAMAVEIGTDVMILVSGTASITRSETQHLGDAVAQTSETLANIEALISEANLARHGLPGFGCTLSSLAVVRVYIKRQADYPAVRAMCESRLGQVPVTYTLADVCRPQLLVEIEGIAFGRWGLASS